MTTPTTPAPALFPIRMAASGPPPAAHTPNIPALLRLPNLGKNLERAWPRHRPSPAIASLGRFIQERYFWFLLAACAAAACCPGPGLWLRGVSFGEVSLFGEKVPLALPTLMLAFLLF